jgi:hypothetical protein
MSMLPKQGARLAAAAIDIVRKALEKLPQLFGDRLAPCLYAQMQLGFVDMCEVEFQAILYGSRRQHLSEYCQLRLIGNDPSVPLCNARHVVPAEGYRREAGSA